MALKKAIFYFSPKNQNQIFGGGRVGVKLMIQVPRTSKVRPTQNRLIFNTLRGRGCCKSGFSPISAMAHIPIGYPVRFQREILCPTPLFPLPCSMGFVWI